MLGDSGVGLLEKEGGTIETALLDWFRDQRGIEPETLGFFGVEQDGEWVKFPYSYGTKLRSSPLVDGPRRFQNPKGASLDLFKSHTEATSTAFLVEGETDTMRLTQELEMGNSVFGLPGVASWQPHFADYFRDSERVYVVLDNDAAYPASTATEKAWKQIRNDLGKKAKRVVLPADVKDLCEFFDKYDLDLFRELCVRKSPILSRLTRLNLMVPPTETDWLVEDYLAAGDVNLFIGDPGLGKSWLMMDLAIKVAEGKGKWLDRQVLKGGRVLYIDEENPEDIILGRFNKLGLSEQAAKNIHFLYRPGIWLNREPDVLIDEAEEVEPILIILDSLTALHSVDENNANAMRGLFKEAINPLARDTGATVIVIHHTTKDVDASSFKRARGSGDLTAVVDCAVDARGTDEPGIFTLSQYKSRRRLGGELITVAIEDTLEGKVRLAARPLPF